MRPETPTYNGACDRKIHIAVPDRIQLLDLVAGAGQRRREMLAPDECRISQRIPDSAAAFNAEIPPYSPGALGFRCCAFSGLCFLRG